MTDSPLLRMSRCAALPAGALLVETGALMGDPIGGLGDVVAGDVYALDPGAAERELVIARGSRGPEVGAGSSLGTPGAAIAPLARHQLMSERGAGVEVLVVEIEGARHVLPLGPLGPRDEYTLIASEAVAGELASVASVSFTRGTCVTMAGGLQRPVETLEPGERVLTRDHGPRPVRWIGRQSVRAEGANAPVVISEGAMGNARTLILSPDHRLFVYQRTDALRAGRRELLVRARHLVNDDTVWRDAGGYVEYFHLLFDAHEIIYVEGIPAESLLVSEDVLAGFDEALSADVTLRLGGRAQAPAPGLEPSASDFDGVDAAAILRRASTR
ncbi:Hint domain-containing protein [Jannaschia sp. W003]|uniref:Hint domain-containing protein n=1 Tax=Jannaschia sp. W003 TaxID=2867012 RepID=UPI0021A5F9CA|nr:Hint domain-containing protein [Jannaschia sp. W003]UWQ22799.1 Hint domain-containing protein [Jannaschia sp. W003]